MKPIILAIASFVAALSVCLAIRPRIVDRWAVTAGIANYLSSQPASHWGANYMPNPEVVDQQGNTYRFYDDLIKGKKVIISFIYTYCSQICPLTTSRLAMLQDKLGDAIGRDYFIYSITIDPEHDHPEELKKYAEAFNVKPGWKFLTGNPNDIADIRYKLGERSRILSDHRQEIVLGNDALGLWSRDSVLGDLDRVALSVRALDPDANIADGRTGIVSSSDKNVVSLAPGEALFGRMCASCHTIGRGILVGPDLKDVTSRRESEWLKKFVSEPEKAFADGDPAAIELARQFPAVRMPNLGLSADDAEDVLNFVAARSLMSEGFAPDGPIRQVAK